MQTTLSVTICCPIISKIDPKVSHQFLLKRHFQNNRNLLNSWATCARKFVTKNFQIEPKLVTLITINKLRDLMRKISAVGQADFHHETRFESWWSSFHFPNIFPTFLTTVHTELKRGQDDNFVILQTESPKFESLCTYALPRVWPTLSRRCHYRVVKLAFSEIKHSDWMLQVKGLL